MAAASAGLATVSRRASAEDSGKESGTGTEDAAQGRDSSTKGLPVLPDTPSKTDGLLRVPSVREANAMTSQSEAQVRKEECVIDLGQS